MKAPRPTGRGAVAIMKSHDARVAPQAVPRTIPADPPGGRLQTPSRPWLQMRAVSLAGSRRWKALESLTAGSSSPEPPGQLIATDMGAIRSQSVGWVWSATANLRAHAHEVATGG